MDYTSTFSFEVKSVSENGHLVGYASTFGGPPDLQGDICEPGCFRKTIAETRGKVPILMGHIMARIVGFGTHAEEDSKGLLVHGEFTDNDEGRNAHATARHAARVGSPLGLSIGYSIADTGGFKMDSQGYRHLHEVTLWEYSLAATPANPRARISAVKAADLQPDDWERLFRTNGFSKRETEKLVFACKNVLTDPRHEDPNDLAAFLRRRR